MISDNTPSFWFRDLGDCLPRPALRANHEVDVAIAGAGFTGLWTAYYLACLRPELRICLIDAAHVGYGASGRNGGWCTAALAGLDGMLSDPASRDAGVALARAMFDAVDEVGRVCRAEKIDCHYTKGGALRVATSPPQLEEIEREIAALRDQGFGEEDYRLLGVRESAQRIGIERNLGAIFASHCAVIQPARLVRGLADAVEARGVEIFEHTAAAAIEPGRIVTRDFELRARTVVRATEAYTKRLTGHRRRLVPLHSMMIATEPLSDRLWERLGLRERETFGDARRIVTYGQRTADGRIAFGGRASYRFGSGIADRFDPDDPRFASIERTLFELFPALRGVEITHRWGGALGVGRDWRAGVGFDRSTRLAWAGGYVGEGVAASNLAGRTLADLITGNQTDRCGLAWVGPEMRNWEPEPLRWLAVAGISAIGASADRVEFARGRRPSLRAWLFDRIVGL